MATNPTDLEYWKTLTASGTQIEPTIDFVPPTFAGSGESLGSSEDHVMTEEPAIWDRSAKPTANLDVHENLKRNDGFKLIS